MPNIRTAIKEDAPILVNLNSKIFVNNIQFDEDLKTDPAPISYFEESIAKSDGCFLILEEDGQIIGYTNGAPIHFGYRKSKYFEVINIGVIPEAKGKGYGKMLLEAITQWAKEHGYQKMYLNCYFKNEEAIEFYKRNGYSEIDICLEKTI